MTDRKHDIINDWPSDPQVEILIARIVDGEASREERERFESLAATDTSLWRRLALRHQDMAMLAAHVEPTLNAAESIELPHAAHVDHADADAESTERDSSVVGSVGSSSFRIGSSWWLAVSGWAAMIALALAWAGSGLVDGNSDERNRRVMGADTRSAGIGESPESHLERYLAAPFVLGEMPPTLLNAEQLSDGRYAVSYLRRIVEVKYYDSAADIPVDGEGNLVSSPREVQRYDARPTEEQAPKP